MRSAVQTFQANWKRDAQRHVTAIRHPRNTRTMRKPRPTRRSNAIAPQRPLPMVGVGWYTEPEWSLVKAAAADPEVFEQSFDEWVVMAEEALARMRGAGIEPHKVLVKSSELLAWCFAHAKVNNAPSRAEFVSEQLRIRSERDA